MSTSKKFFSALLSAKSESSEKRARSEALTFNLHILDSDELWEIELSADTIISASVTSRSLTALSIALRDETFRACIEGKETIQEAFFKKKVQVSGSLYQAMRIGKIFSSLVLSHTHTHSMSECEDINKEHFSFVTSFANTMRGMIGYGDESRDDRIIFILPPHPLMGGDMLNNVVQSLFSSLARAGFVTVTCDYALVFDEKLWQSRERMRDYTDVTDEVREFIEGARKHINSDAHILCIGYSFGAFIAHAVSEKKANTPALLISFPISAYDFTCENEFSNASLWIVSDSDEFCPLASARDVTCEYNIPLVVCEKTDHFFRGKEDQLSMIVTEKIEGLWKKKLEKK